MAHTAIRLGYISTSGGGGGGIVEFANLAAFPAVGQGSLVYLALDTKKIYKWSSGAYLLISPSEVTSVNTEVGEVVLDKADIGLGNVDNTSDADKPISDDTQDALDAKQDSLGFTPEDVANKTTNTALGTSDTLYPTQNAVKSYVDTQITNNTTPDATTLVKGKVKLAGDLSGTADLPTVPELANKEPTITAGTTSEYWRGDKTFQTLDKSAVGLSDVDNTSDADKPISSATQTALNDKLDASQVGVPNGAASLDGSGKVPSAQLPSYVDDVLEYADLAAFPVTGETGIIYLALDTNKIYRWSGSAYIEISQGITDHTLLSNIGTNTHADIDSALNLIVNVNWTGDYNNGVTYTVGDGVMYNGASFRMIASIGAAGYAPPAYPGNWLQVTDYVSPNDIGLGNVDNTSDADKPISDDTQDALDAKQDSLGFVPEDVSNKSTTTALGTSDTLYPTQNAVKTYVDNAVTGGATPDATTLIKGKVKLAGDLSGTADLPTVPGLATKEPTITATTAADYYRGDKTFQTLNKAAVGLPNVDDTSDLDKPISDDTQDALDLKVDLAGDIMTGELTMQDAPIVVDYTTTQGFPTTTELNANSILLLSNNGTDSKELNQTSSTSTLNRINIASATSDANMVLSVEDGAPYLLAQTTDYANDTFSQTTMGSQNISIDFTDNASGVNSTVVFGAGAYAIQTTQSDGSYIFIEGTDTGTSATQFDGVDSTPLMPTLPEHYTVKEYVDNLVSGGETGIVERFEVMKEPTGFIDRTSSTTSFVDLTREFTIAPTGASYDVYVQGDKFTKSASETITLDNLSGNHYIYFNSLGNLASTQVINSDLFQNNALISVIYWNSDTSSHTYFAEERHGLTMDGATHSYLHTIFGARYLSGLALQNFVVNGNGSLATHAQFTSDSGSIRDEDLLITMLAQTQIPVLYRQGQLWRKKAADSFPIIYNGTAGYTGTRLPFNEFTGGAWQLTEVANNAFVLVHVFATNDKETPVVAIQGIATYGNVTAARLAASSEITSLSGLPFAEFVAVGSVVFESANAYTNTPKAIIRSINGGDYVDFRGTQLYTPAGEPTTHGLLSGLSSDDHLQYHTDARGDARYNLKSAGDISEGSFSLANNEPLATSITGFAFDNGIVRSFEAQVSIKIDATSDLFEEIKMSGIQKGSSWEISLQSTGDESGVQFSITNAGQIQYTSPNYSGFVSGTIKFRALTTSV
jgi:hypothetical protein